MHRLRIFSVVVIAMLVIVLGVQSSTALAGNTTQYHVRLNDATIPFGFPVGEFCPQFPQPLSIDSDPNGSDRVKNATERLKVDGSRQVVVTDLIKGTATDEFGGSYSFVYQNDATFIFDGSTISVAMKDTFVLKGPTSYVAGFNWRWVFPADNMEVIPVFENGQLVDVQVAPNLPPTEDGFTEAPFIIPGSWQQLSTRNDPWNCDPL